MLGARQFDPALQLHQHDGESGSAEHVPRKRCESPIHQPRLAGEINRSVTVRSVINRLTQQEDLNFLLTNRIPRRLATRFMGWFTHIEQPLVRDLSIAVWRFLAEVDLSDAEKKQFASVHDCFTRALRDGARPIDFDPNTLVSPCDAIVGACGVIAGTELLQVKGRPYTLKDLFGDSDLVDVYRDGCYATLRLTAGMYHRFHAAHDCLLERSPTVPANCGTSIQ